MICYAEIKPGKKVLELGPGTGQATEPILNTGCSYHAIELGEHLADMMRSKYGKRANADIINADLYLEAEGTLEIREVAKGCAIMTPF